MVIVVTEIQNKPIRLSAGRKAFSEYFKATRDKVGQLELMIHYLETGNQFTVDFGNIDVKFFSNLESEFEKIVTALEEAARVYSR